MIILFFKMLSSDNRGSNVIIANSLEFVSCF